MNAKKWISTALVASLFLQNGILVSSARADSQPIYHIALTPSEKEYLNIDTLERELSDRARVTQKADTVNKATSAVMFLAISGAALYYVVNSGQAHMPSAAPHELMPSVVGPQEYYSRFEDFIYKLFYVVAGNTQRAEALRGLSRSTAVKAAVLATSPLAANALLSPLYWAKSWLVKKSVYKINGLDEQRLQDAFGMARTHLDHACQTVNAQGAKNVDRSLFQSMRFTDADFAAGQVYLDGRPLTLDEARTLNTAQSDVYYVSASPVKCKTGYLSSATLDQLLSARVLKTTSEAALAQ